MRAELRRAVDRVGRRLRLARLLALLAACWLAFALAGLAFARLAPDGGALSRLGWQAPAWGLGLAALAAVGISLLVLRTARDRRALARRIEARHPELSAGLLSALEIDDRAGPGPMGFLDSTVVQAALDHSRAHDWAAVVPRWLLGLAHAGQVAGLLMLAGVASLLFVQARPGGPIAAVEIAAPTGLTIEPGDVELEKGSPLLVVARFNDRVPAEATLMIEGADGISRPMTRSLEDPTFAARVESVDADLTYKVAFGSGAESKSYRVKTFELPEVVRTDAGLDFPGYTALAPKRVEDIRHVTAVEGTDLTLDFRLNKPVVSARLVDAEGEAVELVSAPGGSNVYQASLKLADPRKLRVELIDADGRKNKWPSEIALNVTRNRPPTLKASRPARDVRVSPVEELALAAQVADDFGVTRLGVSFGLGGDEPREIEMPVPAAGTKKVDLAHLLDFEALGVEPDQLATYHFWAEDIGPDGQPRRASGDLYFAEVRPFEEIFRQGDSSESDQQQRQQQQQQGQGGAAQQAAQLAELQKQIINATWSLVRRETGAKPTDKLAEDAAVVRQSQAQAIETAGAVGGQLTDAASKAHFERALSQMREAEVFLGESADGPATGPLAPALASEQAAYQSLLKLRDREFQVVRGQRNQQGGGGGGGGSPSQQQLQQLELSNEQNRYEQRSQAEADGTDQDPAQRELRQVMNRLRELAQRQEDLNERLQELQSSLQAAKNEEAREEIERQLKRLRDQQEEILRDTDELQERMEQEQNREQMAEAREQVEQSRENVRRASEALEEGQVSQAITEGTRASRQMDQLREQLRKESSNRFSEEMTSMRDEARRLAAEQQALTDRLSSPDQKGAPSLRKEDNTDPNRQALQQQKEEFQKLVERMRSTVQEAEETEPLLASDLFDAARQADQAGIEKALDAADRLADLGVAEEAARASRQAAEGLDELREGVERAAGRVLGDETAALRLARGELDQLSEAIDRELARAGADLREGEQPGEGERGQPGGRQGEPREGTGREAGEGEAGEAGRRPSEGEGQEPSQDQGEGGNQRGEGQGRGESQPGQGGGQGQGERDGQQPGDRQPDQGEGQQAGQERGEGQQPGEGRGRGQGEGQRPGQGEGEGEGEGQGEGQSGEGQGQGGRQPGGQRAGAGGGGGNPNAGGLERLLNEGPGLAAGPGNPITGDGYREWSDRMRDVEELLDAPDLQAEAARIRDRVRGARDEFRRHAREPDPGNLRDLVAEPLRELRQRVDEEVRRRDSPDSLVPIDRDPVPPAYAEGVRRYYERLGSGQ